MSEIMYVLKNKNKYEKEAKKRKEQEIAELRDEGRFRVALNKDIEELRCLFNDDNLLSVTIRVGEKDLPKFSKALHFDEMNAFEWVQLAPDVFKIMRSEI